MTEPSDLYMEGNYNRAVNRSEGGNTDENTAFITSTITGILKGTGRG
jgi:hypothetical protein